MPLLKIQISRVILLINCTHTELPRVLHTEYKAYRICPRLCYFEPKPLFIFPPETMQKSTTYKYDAHQHNRSWTTVSNVIVVARRSLFNNSVWPSNRLSRLKQLPGPTASQPRSRFLFIISCITIELRTSFFKNKNYN